MGSRASRALICEGGQMFPSAPSGLYYIFFAFVVLLITNGVHLHLHVDM